MNIGIDFNPEDRMRYEVSWHIEFLDMDRNWIINMRDGKTHYDDEIDAHIALAAEQQENALANRIGHPHQQRRIEYKLVKRVTLLVDKDME